MSNDLTDSVAFLGPVICFMLGQQQQQFLVGTLTTQVDSVVHCICNVISQSENSLFLLYIWTSGRLEPPVTLIWTTYSPRVEAHYILAIILQHNTFAMPFAGRYIL